MSDPAVTAADTLTAVARLAPREAILSAVDHMDAATARLRELLTDEAWVWGDGE